jgi:hypothetical protein
LPVRHRERGIDLLRAAKEVRRRGVFEVVELREAGEERFLRRRRSGVRKHHLADTGVLLEGEPGPGD